RVNADLLKTINGVSELARNGRRAQRDPDANPHVSPQHHPLMMNAAASRVRRYDVDLGLGTGVVPPCARRCSSRSPIPAWGSSPGGSQGCRAGGAAVMYVLAGRVD